MLKKCFVSLPFLHVEALLGTLFLTGLKLLIVTASPALALPDSQPPAGQWVPQSQLLGYGLRKATGLPRQ